MASSGFYTYSDTTGVITPNTDNLRTTVQGEYQSAFGDSLILNGNTPQGVLMNAETLARTRMLQLNATLANQINPNYAGGVFLDAILALTGSYRTSSMYTIVNITGTGVSGTNILSGSLVQDNVGNLFSVITPVTIVNGTFAATVQAVASGPITVSPNTITTIVSNILGWETVTNPDIQVSVGSTVQSDSAARTLRRVTLAAQGNSVTNAITSAIYLVPNVTNVLFRQNVSSSPATIDGVLMAAHSIYICEAGGDTGSVASAINQKKSGGCGYNNAIGYSGNGTTFAVTTQTGDTTLNSTQILNLSTGTTNLFIGQGVSGTGIPAGTTILSILSSNSISITNGATATNTGTTLTFAASPYVTGLTSDIRTIMGVGSTITGANIPAGATVTAVLSSTAIKISSPAIATGTAAITVSAGIPQDVPITDPDSGQTIDVLFDNPSLVPIAVQVNANKNSSLQDIVGTIQDAIVAYAAGNIDQDPGLEIGTEVSPFAIAAAIGNQAPSIFITNVQISRLPNISFSNSIIPISIFQQATIQAADIQVVLS